MKAFNQYITEKIKLSSDRFNKVPSFKLEHDVLFDAIVNNAFYDAAKNNDLKLDYPGFDHGIDKQRIRYNDVAFGAKLLACGSFYAIIDAVCKHDGGMLFEIIGYYLDSGGELNEAITNQEFLDYIKYYDKELTEEYIQTYKIK